MSRAALTARRAPVAPHGRRPAPARGSLDERQAACDAESAVDARRREATPPGATAPRGGAGGGRLALGDLVAGVWEGLLAAGVAACPVCRGAMRLEQGRGRCEGCGAALD